jgi:hypothetical protein
MQLQHVNMTCRLTYNSAAAVPTSDAALNKSFKIGVTFDKRVLYITESGEASEQAANGVDCVLTEISAGNNRIACGSVKGGFAFNELHPLAGAMKPVADASSNSHWSIDSNNVLSWKTNNGKEIAFSIAMMDPGNFSPNDLATTKKIYAEVCSTAKHPDGRLFKAGVAKAYFA